MDAIPSGVDLAFQNKQYGTLATPIYCITGFGSSAFGEGQLSYDERLDGCPGIVADTSAGGMLVSDGFGNIFMADNGFNEVRELPLNNTFPATPVGVKVTQPCLLYTSWTAGKTACCRPLSIAPTSTIP